MQKFAESSRQARDQLRNVWAPRYSSCGNDALDEARFLGNGMSRT